jgi:hypothetical protein
VSGPGCVCSGGGGCLAGMGAQRPGSSRGEPASHPACPCPAGCSAPQRPRPQRLPSASHGPRSPPLTRPPARPPRAGEPLWSAATTLLLPAAEFLGFRAFYPQYVTAGGAKAVPAA